MSEKEAAAEQIEITETPEKLSKEAVTTPDETVAETVSEPTGETEKIDPDQFHGLLRKTNKQKKELRDERRRIAELERKLAEVNSKPEPKADDFDSYDDFVNAKVDYEVSKRTQKPDPSYDPNRAFIDDLTEAGTAKYPDFTQKAYASPSMFEALDEMDSPADIAYFLGQNPAEAQRIARMDTLSQVREFTKIETSLAKPKPRTSHTPPPVKPLENAPSVSKDPSEMSMAEYAAYRNSVRWKQGKP